MRIDMNLNDFFSRYPRCALGFSGGTDSAYLLAAAIGLGADVQPYFVRTAFQPEFELDDAGRLCGGLGVALKVLDYDILAVPGVAENPRDRCYFCKRAIFSLISDRAAADGYPAVIDGTNASDDADDRPGMKAVSELGVLSPLRICGITKDRVRQLSRELGLFTADKPAYACLATRIPAGNAITAEDLQRVELSEKAMTALGYRDFRVRLTREGDARLEMPDGELLHAAAERADILKALGPYFRRVTLDLRGR